MERIRPGRHFFQHRKWAPFEMLAHLDPGLIIDAGAANGSMTKAALRHAKPGSRAIAFEPFPGNWPTCEKNLAGSPATLIKAALGAKPGIAKFYVRATVPESGYSSLGYLVETKSLLERFKMWLRRRRHPDGRMYSVPVVRVDDHATERVLFLKIDVQGGELGVLKGARNAFDRGVDLLYVEFGGELDVLRFLLDRGYIIFDQEYLLPQCPQLDLEQWDIVREDKLTTGRQVFRGWLKSTPEDPGEFCALFDRWKTRVGSVQTDIVAMRPDIYERLKTTYSL